jgi:Family of unknown function (DUF7002)
VEISEFVAKHPLLFHMAEAGTWPQIEKHGLLSTSALLDLFGVSGDARFAIESVRRSEIVTITHPEDNLTAQIRDNKPLRGQFLVCLPGTTPQQFFELLNGKVFFWVSRQRLERLIAARAYRTRAHDVLSIDSADLLAKYFDKASLASINTGSTLYPTAPARGHETFVPIDQFDWEAARRARGRQNAIVELAIEYAVPDIAQFAAKVERRQNGHPSQILFER